ncbi:hydroxyethylthiazole kinase [Periweissella fabaria]|uniref:Hydroxyethylthiazole kinase n=1 Tax=Periweissella fabaria TaxID=546157 RepID=A0ABN8BI12_9LACO|nr:hydroxyethylthiazole kinase [Periweissella fabaria]MCM0597393.1 hydroxyethylthiazole kinase [Periweissella fabaria]CAH0416101.1 Hydroxyethylthiazole kinase [Periweissella fabaria]
MLNYQLLDQVRATTPVIVTFANYVTPQIVANAVNVIGGSPIMSLEPAEAAALVSMATAVTLNLGTAQSAELDFVELVALGKAANELNLPVIIDPVAVSVPFRSQYVARLLKEIKVDVIRGNASEIAHFAGVAAESRGIDAVGEVDIEAVAIAAAKNTGMLIVLSGPTDIVTDGNKVYKIKNGHELLAANVGSGDMLSSILGTFLLKGQDRLEGLALATLSMAVAGQLAGQKNEGKPGTFSAALLDELYQLTPAKLEQFGDWEEIND